MIKNLNKILFYGYGNPGRQDDGLGINFCEKLKVWAKKNNFKIDFDINYQLNIEDSFIISDYNLVIFVDSAKNLKNCFSFKKIKPIDITYYTSHRMLPENIIFLCKKLYNKTPESYLLTIKGYSWNFKENLTKRASNNLENALNFIKKFILKLL